jgi:hypothetical protein
VADCDEKIARQWQQMRERELTVEGLALRRNRPIRVEWAQHPPSPGQRIGDRRQVAPDQIDHLHAEHLADIGEYLGDGTGGGGFGDRQNRITHAVPLYTRRLGGALSGKQAQAAAGG